MIWKYLGAGSYNGRFNMNMDISLAKALNINEALLRFYRWNPYCISLGANQDFDSVDIKLAHEDNIDVVKRPTGGRAILHSEELTYSVVYPVDYKTSPRELYKTINNALLTGLKIFNHGLANVELETEQPDFPSAYKEDINAVCFALSAKSELKYKGRKLVGSAQRKLGNAVLQHGSILCGGFHKQIVNYLKQNESGKNDLKREMDKTTTDLHEILNEKIDYEKLEMSLLSGFESYFNVKFEKAADLKILFDEKSVKHESLV